MLMAVERPNALPLTALKCRENYSAYTALGAVRRATSADVNFGWLELTVRVELVGVRAR